MCCCGAPELAGEIVSVYVPAVRSTVSPAERVTLALPIVLQASCRLWPELASSPFVGLM
jgi:hypothetical protein